MSKAQKIILDLLAEENIIWQEWIRVNNPRFWTRVFLQGSLGLGDSYMDGDWEPVYPKTIDEVVHMLCRLNIHNKIKQVSTPLKIQLLLIWIFTWCFSWVDYLVPKLSLKRSKKVAEQHYNLGNKFYEKWLDPTMNYSCAFFTKEGETLEEAQINKMELIRNKLKLSPGQKVLDIGCGWGSLSNYLSKFGVDMDGVTISESQLDWAKEKYPQLNLNLCDYRLWNPNYKYDKIVSVGMFEHVCPENYKIFMKKVWDLLEPGGLFLLHTIGGNKSRKVGDAWITKHIFPNSCLPSLKQISEASEGLFNIMDVHNFGFQYDKTLMAWHKNWVKTDQRDIRFKRMWEYYLLSCAGLFRAGEAQLYQVVLMKSPFKSYLRV